MEKLKLALIGCGRMGAFTSDTVKKYSPSCWFPMSHLDAAIKIDNIEIVAVCDKSNSTLLKIKKYYGVKNVYNNYLDMLKNEKIDILSIATRTPGRSKIIFDAVSNGINSFHVEKPICNSTNELKKLEALSYRKKLNITYGTLRRYLDIYIKAKLIIDSKKYGALKEIDIDFGHDKLMWLHPHSIDTILFFAGDQYPLYVQSLLSNFNYCRIKNKKELLIDKDPTLEFANLFFKNKLFARISNRGDMDVILHCEKGIIIIEADGKNLFVKKVKAHKSPYKKYKKEKIKVKQKNIGGTGSALSLHLNKKGKKYMINSETIFKGQKILFSLVKSHLEKSSLVEPKKMKEKITINGKYKNFYA